MAVSSIKSGHGLYSLQIQEERAYFKPCYLYYTGITTDGYKDILNITIGTNKTSKFWLGMLYDLKNRGVQDVLFICVDVLAGFKKVIGAVYPNAQIQRYAIHVLRNSFKHDNYNDLKKFSSDFKFEYHVPNEITALSKLKKPKKNGERKYPYAISNWEDASSFFQFSDDIWRILHVPNIIKGLNRQYLKVTKTKSMFLSDSSLEKIRYLASENMIKK